jgi:GT2 family glycosyltransferase
MIEASVVIATRNRAGFLRNCLDRLARQTAAGRFEIVVVDNGSTDDSAAVIARAMRSEANVRTTRVEDPNRAKARNAGIAESRGDAVIFCDDDTLAPEGFVEAHLRARAVRPRAAVSGPIVNVADADHLMPPGPRHFSRAFLCTCNAGIARADLEAVGGFDERYDLYGWEDTDLGVRLRAAGVRRAWSWEAYIYHVKPPEVLTLDTRLTLAREKGSMAARFVRKSPTLPVKLATGAYAANFARAAIVGAPPLRRWYERAVERSGTRSVLGGFAAEALVDAAYIDALRSGLRRRDA